MAKASHPIPPGMRTVTAMLAVDGAAEAIDLYARAFGAVELPGRAPDPSGKKIWHAEIRIGDSIVFVNDASPEMGNPARPSALWLCVEDCDAFYARAVAAGLKSEMPPMDMFWGDRTATVVDPYGYAWSFATHVRDLTEDEMRKAGEEFARQMAAKPQ